MSKQIDIVTLCLETGWICKISQYINDNPGQYGQVKYMKRLLKLLPVLCGECGWVGLLPMVLKGVGRTAFGGLSNQLGLGILKVGYILVKCNKYIANKYGE